MSVTAAVIKRIETEYHGRVFITASLLDLGSRSAIDQVLKRLVEKGKICRLARGVFWGHPAGERVATPGADQIAFSIADQEGIKLQISGEEAAYRLGLISSIPSRPVYDTSGLPREIRLDRYTIYFRAVSEKRLALCGTAAGMAIAALTHLGAERVNDEILKKIEIRIGTEEMRRLVEARNLMPGWLAKKIQI